MRIRHYTNDIGGCKFEGKLRSGVSMRGPSASTTICSELRDLAICREVTPDQTSAAIWVITYNLALFGLLCALSNVDVSVCGTEMGIA